MKERSFKRIRADINSHLSSLHKKNYLKSSPEDPRKLLLHCLAQFKIKIDLPTLKHKVCRSILFDWIQSGFDLQELEIQVRTESANWYSTIARRNERRGIPKGISEGVHKNVISHLSSQKFYASKEWKHLRYEVLSEQGNSCQCCGAKPSDGVQIHVDHIKPRSIFPELSLDKNNLQILCENCNVGKSNIRTEDWRNA